MEEHIRAILKDIGEDPKREGLLKTPERVAKAYKFLTKGYHEDPKKILNGAVFKSDTNEMVVVMDIDFFSLCEHHMLPFYGKCHVAYLPKGKIIGLSKVARLVEMFARRLQVQERLTQQIAETLLAVLKPLGVAVVMEGEHLCMRMRGVQSHNSKAITSSMLGAFRDRHSTREEFLGLIHRRM